ncbi:MAG: Cof-type HAD-IIB family hydrolase [Lachnospiraceae bacterium]|nr:Cof-type HAD-IIB family hydrolase [Lachnospiraceae bacterium]
MRIRFLAIDMDGTCLNPHSKISEQTMNALKACADAGVMIVPTTGRALSCLPYQLAENPDLYRYVISSNGAQITDCHNRSSVYQVPIDKECALSLLESCRKERLGITAHISQEYLMQGKILIFIGRIIYGKDAGNTIYVKDMSDTIRQTGGVLEELQFYFLSQTARENVRDIMKCFPELSAAYDRSYVEIFSKDASKGNALSELSSYLQIDPEQVACIGDGENDLSLFQAAGIKFAMGNAVPDLKSAADIILPSNKDDGVAYAITNYILSH